MRDETGGLRPESRFRHPKSYSYPDCSFIIPGSLVRIQAGLFCGRVGASSGCVGRVHPAKPFQTLGLKAMREPNAPSRAPEAQKDLVEIGNSSRLRARFAGCAMG